MSTHKEKILKLRAKGHTYDQICSKLGCSKGTVSYHCGKGQKIKTRNRLRVHRKKVHPYDRKLEYFLYNKQLNNKTKTKSCSSKILLKSKIETFSFNYPYDGGKYMKPTFTTQDVIDKFGENPQCYLTGKSIDINKPRTYQFDHIIPRSRGGDNSIDNLGICTKDANQAKGDKTPDEFIHLCKQILEHNGYTIIKNSQ